MPERLGLPDPTMLLSQEQWLILASSAITAETGPRSLSAVNVQKRNGESDGFHV